MPLLSLENAGLAFGHLPLFEHADFQIESGERVCLIGRNGSGKSTLLKVIAGELQPDAGAVRRAPGVRISRLEQDVPGTGVRTVFEEVAAGLGDLGALVARYHQAAVRAAEEGAGLEQLGALQHELETRDGWRLEQRVETVLSRLGLPADRAMSELSGGWRRRALLGKVLVSQPDLLLLDEPTNHLDIDAIRWLEDYLRGYTGALLFVTHDRAFLEALATRIIELDRGRLTSWPGSYAAYLEKKAAALEAEARGTARLDRRLAQEEAWLRRGVKARRTRNEGRVKALLALRAERAARREREGTVTMSVDSSIPSGRIVFEADAVSKAFDGVPVIAGFSQRILRGDRVGLIGPNGCGKSTLLKLLVGELQPDSGTIRRGTRLQIAYFDQQREQLDPDASVADTVSEGSPTVTVNGRDRHVIGYLGDFLFSRERIRSPVRSLSGGERNRLMLARLFARPANVLILDEPTNDLDIETLELLEELIAGFDGTVLLVSHDRVFLDNLVTSTLVFEGGGRVVEYVGGWRDYLRQSEGSSPADGMQSRDAARMVGPDPPNGRARDPRETATGPGLSPKDRSRQKRKLSYNEQRELEQLSSRIEALEAEQERLRRESASPDFYKETPEHIHGVLARLEVLQSEIDAAIARWLELQDLS